MRLLLDNARDAFANMAIDESIMEYGKPTLRLYSWSPPAVSIGYFQSMDAEVDTENCRYQGIDCVRRITGGGAVFHEHELTYSLVVPESMVPSDILKSYEMICGAVVSALNAHGIDARFCPINDILAGNKKISGSAQTRKAGMVLQHGTVLLDVNVDRMFSILKVPDEKMKDKMAKAVKERVTSFKALGLSYQGFKRRLVSSFETCMGQKLLPGSLTPEEQNNAGLRTQKFRSNAWNRMR
jgi:lipoate-protein ligase A